MPNEWIQCKQTVTAKFLFNTCSTAIKTCQDPKVPKQHSHSCCYCQR